MESTTPPAWNSSPKPRVLPRRTLLRNALALSPLLLWSAQRGFSARPTRAASAGAPRSSQNLPTCVVTPQLTEGPYFVDEHLNRSDIRSDPADGTTKAGVPVRLAFRISQAGGTSCMPLAGAVVDLWQCDALGVYSDARDPGFNTVGQQFLRGYQVTDASGYAEFLTIYPGWYQGRAVHTHFKIRTDPASGAGYEFTSQLFYDDALTDTIHAQSPYAARGQRTMRNENDGIFRDGGQQLVLQLVQEQEGYATTMAIGVDVSGTTSAA